MLEAPGSWGQLQEWFEYYRLEPFGEERADLRAGSVAAAVYNVNLKSGARHLSASDCALKFTKLEEPKERTAEQFRAEFDAHKQLLMAVANN